MRFGEYVKKLREAKNLSLSHAARELGMSVQRLCDIEQGRRNFHKSPPTKMLQKMAVVYDHPYSSLIMNTEFFQYEKKLIDELLTEVEPICSKLERKTLEMLMESRQYTPEMEASAGEAQRLATELRLAISLVKAKFSRAARSKTDETGVPTNQGTNE